MFDTAIIDYQTSNLKSVVSACKIAKINFVVTNNKKEILNSKSLIIPGVGSFATIMNFLKKNNLDKTIKFFYKKNKPILGICLGMQIFFNSSEESKGFKGLNIINMKIKKFDISHKVPNIGWSNVIDSKFSKSLIKMKNNNQFYFVHSYYVDFFKKKNFNIAYSYNFNKKFCSYLNYNNLHLMQFHPEKSGKKGVKIYENFKKIIK